MSTAELQQRAPPDVRNAVQFLRSGKSEMKVRVGALNGKRLDYFKGALATLVCSPPLSLTASSPHRAQANQRSKHFSRQHTQRSRTSQRSPQKQKHRHSCRPSTATPTSCEYSVAHPRARLRPPRSCRSYPSRCLLPRNTTP